MAVFRNREWLVGLVIIALALAVFTHTFRAGFVIGGGEESLTFLNPSRTVSYYQHTWSEVQLGETQTIAMPRLPFFYLLALLFKLGVPAWFLQFITFSLVFAVAGISVYLLAKSFSSSRVGGFVASLFYLFNPFMYSAIWHRYLVAMQFFMALLPLSLWCLNNFLEKRRFVFAVLFLASSLVFLPSFGLPSNLITFWLALGIFVFTRAWTDRNTKERAVKDLLLGAVVFSLWCLTNVWWVFPTIVQSTSAYPTIFSADQNISVLRSITDQYPLIKNLVLSYSETSNLAKGAGALLMLGLVMLGFLNKKIGTYTPFLGTLLLASIFFLNGAAFPTGGVFEYIFKSLSFFQVYRNPYEKFGIVLVLTYSLLFGFGFDLVWKTRRSVAVIVVILLAFALVYPKWSAPLFGSDTYNTYIKVPPDYEKVNQHINSDPEVARILHLPLSAGDGLSYKWELPYFGYNPNLYLFDKASLDKITRIKDEDDYWRILREAFYRGNLTNILKFGNIGYVVLHKDLDHVYAQSDSVKETQSYIATAIAPSTGELREKICDGPTTLIHVTGSDYYDFTCVLSETNQDWRGKAYLTIAVVANVPGKIRVDIQSTGNQHLMYEGEDYLQIADAEVGTQKIFVVNFHTATYHYPAFNFQKVENINIRFKPTANSPEANIKIKRIALDPGRKVANQYFNLVVDTPNLQLFTVNSRDYKPRIYAATKLTGLATWQDVLGTQADAFYLTSHKLSNVNYEYIGKAVPRISFQKINNTRYTMHISGANSPYWLIFSESFHPEWELTGDGQAFDHLKVNGYANGYLVTKTGDYDLELRYRVEDQALFYRKISALVGAGVLIACVLQTLGQRLVKK